jgi:8-oxo-dGTP diphosphatase
MVKRRRGTVIVEMEKGILVVLEKDREELLLPGGGPEEGESRFQAAIRELREETGLDPYLAAPLFRFLSQYSDHSVYYIRANGQPQLTEHTDYIGYYREGRLEEIERRPEVMGVTEARLGRSARAIIKLYQRYRKDNLDWFTALDQRLELKQYTYDVGEE